MASWSFLEIHQDIGFKIHKDDITRLNLKQFKVTLHFHMSMADVSIRTAPARLQQSQLSSGGGRNVAESERKT